jgi:hypothetical protein
LWAKVTVISKLKFKRIPLVARELPIKASSLIINEKASITLIEAKKYSLTIIKKILLVGCNLELSKRKHKHRKLMSSSLINEGLFHPSTHIQEKCNLCVFVVLRMDIGT